MDKRLGFIGCGNMGGAILMGALKNNAVSDKDVSVLVKSEKSRQKYADMGIKVCGDIKELCEASDMLVLAVKPNVAGQVLNEAKPYLSDKAVISIAAGITVDMLKDMTGGARVIRTMPNTPALIGEGAMIVCEETDITAEEKEFTERLFNANGTIYTIAERLMDAASAVGGCSPAFVAMFIEAMADGGVREGLPRALAYSLAEKAVYGSAKMMLEENMHPGVMKDMVTSSGGTTIEGVGALEEGGMRAAVMDCIARCTEKSKRLVK